MREKLRYNLWTKFQLFLLFYASVEFIIAESANKKIRFLVLNILYWV
jgi:hypothetical protein